MHAAVGLVLGLTLTFRCGKDVTDAAPDVTPGETGDTEPVDDPPPPGDGYPRGGNIMVIFMDDIGLDKIAAYGAHPAPARTPNINRMAEEGVLFTHAYSNPTCTPSRSTLLTGRHAWIADQRHALH